MDGLVSAPVRDGVPRASAAPTVLRGGGARGRGASGRRASRRARARVRARVGIGASRRDAHRAERARGPTSGFDASAFGHRGLARDVDAPRRRIRTRSRRPRARVRSSTRASGFSIRGCCTGGGTRRGGVHRGGGDADRRQGAPPARESARQSVPRRPRGHLRACAVLPRPRAAAARGAVSVPGVPGERESRSIPGVSRVWRANHPGRYRRRARRNDGSGGRRDDHPGRHRRRARRGWGRVRRRGGGKKKKGKGPARDASDRARVRCR